TPLYASAETAWQMTDAAFAMLVSSRTPIWARLGRGDQTYDVYLLSDRGGIYALGFPFVTLLGHMMNLAELTVIGAVAFLLALFVGSIFSALTRRSTDAR